MKSILRRGTLAMSLSIALMASATLDSSVLYAQDTSSEAPAQAQAKKTVDLEAVQVTGSRIKGADMATQVPVVTITSDDIQKTGLTSIGDILQQLSSSGSALNTKFDSAGNFGFPPNGGGVGSGSATLDLRNLGANRVLILVDGVRWVNESSASGVSAAVDLNTIPSSIIERIDILQDGASALYGSDAIAGVVNIITKRSQKGAAANFYTGTYNNLGSSGNTTHADISFGNKSDRFEYFVDFSYIKQEEISSDEWSRSRGDCIPGTGLANCSGTVPGGRYQFTDPNTGIAQDLTLNKGFTGTTPSYPDDFHKFQTADRYNYGPENKLLTPSERSAIFVSTRYNLTPTTTWYARGIYNNRRSNNVAAPEPIGFGPGGNQGIGSTIVVDATNPYNPFGFTLDPNTNLTSVSRRPIEGGPRTFTQNVDTTYFGTGLEGSFGLGDHDFYWDTNFAAGNNRATQRVVGSYNILHVKNALGPVANCDPLEGCVPLNIFGGPGSITPEMLKYIQYIEHDNSQNKIGLWSANLSGDLFQLPYGPLAFASGVEHRKYVGSYEPDAIVVAGESNGVPSLPTSGQYSINEYYLELNAPLLEDVPFFKALELSAATRYSDYSTFGGTTNSKVGLRWQVYDDLTLRSTWAEGFRAPSIGELFGSLAEFDATIQDPCSNSRPATAQITANCRALGAPASYVQNGPQIGVRTGGNKNLKPEASTSLTVGAVYSPSWAQSMGWASKLDISLGYYRIKLDDAIQAPDSQTKLDRCVASGDPNDIWCAGIVRSRTGGFAQFDNALENLGGIKTDGYDFGIDWASPQTSIGRFTLNLNNTYVEKYQATSATGELEPRTIGFELTDSSIPRLTSVLHMGWSRNAWSIDTTFRYLSSSTENCAGAAGFPICDNDDITPNRPDGTHRLGAVTYQDLRASWKLPISLDLTLTAGINNLWDKQPPICVSCSLNGYDGSTYDLPSRFTYVQASVRF
jgi:iron complex outermembrane receptor protein